MSKSVIEVLTEACEEAEQLLTKQMDECNAAFTVMPHPKHKPGPILLKLRHALKAAKARELKVTSEEVSRG